MMDVTEIGDTSDFFDDLGGDSLDSLDVAMRLEEAVGRSLPEDEFQGCRCVQDAAKLLLSDKYDFVVQDVPEHGCVNGEICPKAFDKGRGVLHVCEKLGIPVENTYGFGDSMNDLAMIQTVGTSVCMANGSETLKGLSDIVCPSVAEDGLAKAFRDLGLD
jgi:acyl carrier protein